MKTLALASAMDAVRENTPLVHCITNYVTVNDCANALLACGASPIMSDEPEDVRDITSICGGLVLNIGTLNARTIEGMRVAGDRAAELGHTIVLDPVGAGASTLRTKTAGELIDRLPVTVIRGNMSEVRAVAGASATTRGVDVDPGDIVTDETLHDAATFACALSQKTGAVVAITGAIDIVADADCAYAIRNGSALMGKMTGAGCVLTCLVAAYAVANPDAVLEAVVAAIAYEGLAGQLAEKRLRAGEGTGSFRTYLLDALDTMTPSELESGARIERVL